MEVLTKVPPVKPNDDFRVRMQATKHPAELFWLALMSLRLAIILNELALAINKFPYDRVSLLTRDTEFRPIRF